MNLRVKKLYLYLQKHPHIDIVQTSNLLKNPPFGYQFQDDFINGIMLIKTSLSPNQLLQQLLQIEKFFARKRSFANAPRTMDLDIIFFESKKMYNTHLTIPHPHWKERMSILAPLHSLLQHLHKESRL
jgi:2-amino-4-hydroxy-6-hydroxymethyldihydropteridine diphosphokinase